MGWRMTARRNRLRTASARQDRLRMASVRQDRLRMASVRQEPELHTRLPLLGGARGQAFEPVIGASHGLLGGCDIGEGVGLRE
jgi:hypothetical protein